MVTEDKTLFETRIREFTERLSEGNPGGVFDMLSPRYVDCDFDEKTVTLSYAIKPVERNPGGEVNGGITGTMIDTTMGVVNYGLTGKLTPTINLSVSYLRPAPGDDVIVVRAKASKAGRAVVYDTAEVWAQAAPDALVATGEGVFRVFEG